MIIIKHSPTIFKGAQLYTHTHTLNTESIYMSIEVSTLSSEKCYSRGLGWASIGTLYPQRDNMADGDSHLSPQEEEYILEAAEKEVETDIEIQMQREKDLASQKLWCAFQNSATAVAHLFRGNIVIMWFQIFVKHNFLDF